MGNSKQGDQPIAEANLNTNTFVARMAELK